jgi:hypothetical protein
MSTPVSAAAEAAARPALAESAEGAGAAEPAAGAVPPMPTGVQEALHALWDDARGALGERLRLLGLEARLATMTVIQVVVIAVIVAVLGVTSWLLLVGGIFAAFVAAGLHWGIAVALLIVVNLGVAFALVKTAVNLAGRVSLPRSLRQLANRSDSDQP